MLVAVGVSGGLGAGMGHVFNTSPGEVKSEDIQAAGAVTSAALWSLLVTEVLGLGATILGVRRGFIAHARVESAVTAVP